MESLRCPETLAPDWLPPRAIARDGDVSTVAEWIRRRGGGGVVGVHGPPGSGTSTVARLAARSAAGRGVAPGERPARVFAVRTRFHSGPVGIAGELLQSFDAGFRGRGFPMAEVLAGFLRRLTRDGASAIVVLDDVTPAGPELHAIVHALTHPDRFLPEGLDRAPSISVVLAGTSLARATWSRLDRLGLSSEFCRELRPYTPSELRAIALDRLERAYARPMEPPWLPPLVATVAADAGNARRLLELLRDRSIGAADRARPGLQEVHGTPTLWPIEPHVVRAVGEAIVDGIAELPEIRRCEARLALAAGRRPLAATTLWRRLVRLEEFGWVRRTVRPGGRGGTHSSIALLRALPDPGTFSPWVGTLPASGAGPSRSCGAAEPGGWGPGGRELSPFRASSRGL
ncbi:MAG: hypothetical protein L3K03_06960 [Thermoplasmata archaeon]|nr:hypothetical protein [Thermoplasmata archaeon]